MVSLHPSPPPNGSKSRDFDHCWSQHRAQRPALTLTVFPFGGAGMGVHARKPWRVAQSVLCDQGRWEAWLGRASSLLRANWILIQDGVLNPQQTRPRSARGLHFTWTHAQAQSLGYGMVPMHTSGGCVLPDYHTGTPIGASPSKALSSSGGRSEYPWSSGRCSGAFPDV